MNTNVQPSQNSIALFTNMIKVCESASGKGSRTLMTDAISTLDADARKLCYLALNPYITFGIKKLPECSMYSSEDSDLGPFFELCDKLAARKLTGNAAKLEIIDVLELFTQETAALLERVLRKNLQTKFSRTIYNSVVPESDKVPVFDVMLADKCTSTDNDSDQTGLEISELIEPYTIADFKYDGVRTIVICEGPEKISFYSREGIQMTHCDGLFDTDLVKLYNHYGPFVLDAEQFSGSWEATINAKKTGTNSAKNNMRLHAIFIMPLEDWTRQQTNITMAENIATLARLHMSLSLEKIEPTQHRILHTVEEVRALLKEVTTPGFYGLPNGLEGLILKKPSSTYSWDRVIDWCKLKNFYDVDMQVLAVELGKPNTRLAGVMGKVYCRGVLEDGTIVEGYVGSGWTDQQRQQFIDDQSLIVGKTIVVSYQEVTKPSKKRPVPSIRFGTFTRFHDSKSVQLD